MRSVLKQILLYLCLFLGVATLKAQHVEYGVALDTNYMMIGDQQHLTFKAKVDPGVRIVFPRLQDTVVHGLEIISGPVRDSVKEKDGRWLRSSAPNRRDTGGKAATGAACYSGRVAITRRRPPAEA